MATTTSTTTTPTAATTATLKRAKVRGRKNFFIGLLEVGLRQDWPKKAKFECSLKVFFAFCFIIIESTCKLSLGLLGLYITVLHITVLHINRLYINFKYRTLGKIIGSKPVVFF